MMRNQLDKQWFKEANVSGYKNLDTKRFLFFVAMRCDITLIVDTNFVSLFETLC